MKTFQDNQGKSWTISLTNREVRRIQKIIGLNLLDRVQYLQIVGSVSEMLAFIYYLVQAEAKEMGLDEDGFEQRLHGDRFAFDAVQAFLEETESFSQKLGQKGINSSAKQAILNLKRVRMAEMVEQGEFDELAEKVAPTQTKQTPGAK